MARSKAASTVVSPRQCRPPGSRHEMEVFRKKRALDRRKAADGVTSHAELRVGTSLWISLSGCLCCLSLPSRTDRLPPVLAALRGPGSRHGGTHAARPTAIRMAQRRPRDPPSSNPHGTAPPTRPAEQQFPWHSATHATRPAAIPMAQRHPRDTPSSNHHGTAAPTRPAQQQSPWHSGTHATRRAAILMAQRHPRDTPCSNPHGTAPPTPHMRRARDADPHGTAAPTRPAQQQSPWHSATHGTRATRPKRRSAWHGLNDAPSDDATRRDATRDDRADTQQTKRTQPFATHSGNKTDPRTRMHSTKNQSKILIIDLGQQQELATPGNDICRLLSSLILVDKSCQRLLSITRVNNMKRREKT